MYCEHRKFPQLEIIEIGVVHHKKHINHNARSQK